MAAQARLRAPSIVERAALSRRYLTGQVKVRSVRVAPRITRMMKDVRCNHRHVTSELGDAQSGINVVDDNILRGAQLTDLVRQENVDQFSDVVSVARVEEIYFGTIPNDEFRTPGRVELEWLPLLLRAARTGPSALASLKAAQAWT